MRGQQWHHVVRENGPGRSSPRQRQKHVACDWHCISLLPCFKQWFAAMGHEKRTHCSGGPHEHPIGSPEQPCIARVGDGTKEEKVRRTSKHDKQLVDQAS